MCPADGRHDEALGLFHQRPARRWEHWSNDYWAQYPYRRYGKPQPLRCPTSRQPQASHWVAPTRVLVDSREPVRRREPLQERERDVARSRARPSCYARTPFSSSSLACPARRTCRRPRRRARRRLRRCPAPRAARANSRLHAPCREAFWSKCPRDTYACSSVLVRPARP